MKACSRCGETKPLTEFGRRKEGRLGLRSACRSCENSSIRERRRTDPEYRARLGQAVVRCHKKRLENDASYAEEYKALKEDRRRRYRANPEKRERELAADRAWRKENWDRVRRYKHKCGALGAAQTAAYLAAKLRATPAWADMDAIRAIYAEAERITIETGVPHHVDHIFPLRGKTISGLHVANNLQILPAVINKRKSNRLIEGLVQPAV